MSIAVVNPKVIVVHEIGYAERNYVTDDELNYVICGEHFIKRPSPARRSIVTTSIKMIENFELPVYRFQKYYVRKWKFFSKEKWGYKKIDTARGCIITFLDGRRMFVKEIESAVKSLIEDN